MRTSVLSLYDNVMRSSVLSLNDKVMRTSVLSLYANVMRSSVLSLDSKTLPNIFHYILDFFIDRRCACCGAPLEHGRYCICESCENEGIFDNQRLKVKDNAIERRLWGLTSCLAAGALMNYTEDNGAKTLIHNLKYNNDRKVAIQIGEAIAKRIASNDRFGHIDYIVPVPLHAARLKMRGYNQSELIADRIAKILGAQVSTDNLYRCRNNSSQTKEHRLERMENVRGLFDIHDPLLYSGKGVLLIDDVFTTGSTIIECCKALDKTPDIHLYIYTIAAGE